jgi:hypothetical protein
MKPSDTQLVAGFLIREFQSFAEYLDHCDIDPTEAKCIIEDMLKDANGGIPMCTEQFSGFFGE